MEIYWLRILKAGKLKIKGLAYSMTFLCIITHKGEEKGGEREREREEGREKRRDEVRVLSLPPPPTWLHWRLSLQHMPFEIHSNHSIYHPCLNE
jgi:hypothetical protein